MRNSADDEKPLILVGVCCSEKFRDTMIRHSQMCDLRLSSTSKSQQKLKEDGGRRRKNRKGIPLKASDTNHTVLELSRTVCYISSRLFTVFHPALGTGLGTGWPTVNVCWMHESNTVCLFVTLNSCVTIVFFFFFCPLLHKVALVRLR